MAPIHDGSRRELDRDSSNTPVQDPRTLAAVLRSAPDAIVLFDAEGTIADWSPAAERILGYPRGRAVGRNLLKLIAPAEARPEILRAIQTPERGSEGATHRALQLPLIDADGGELQADLNLSWAAGSGLFAAHIRESRTEDEYRHEAVARRRQRLIALGQEVLTAGPIEGLLERSLAAVSEELDLVRAEIWELNGEELLLRTAGGMGVPVGSRMTPAPDSRLAAALRGDERSFVLGDALLPSPWRPPGAPVEGVLPGMASILKDTDGALGALCGSVAVDAEISPSDIEFVESVSMIVASALDRERSQRSREKAEDRLLGLVERLPAITYRAGLGTEGRWLYISPQVEDLLGLTPEECLADHQWWEKCIHPDDRTRVLAEEERILDSGEELDICYRILARDGRMLWVRDRASIGRREGDGPEFVEGLIFDITSQHQAELRLRHLADHDPLTELLNRRGFESAVSEMLAAGDHRSGGALAILDLDHLKRLNDSLGHAVGDAFLCDVAAAIKVTVGPGDVVGRLGGDEFGLYLPGIGQATADQRLREILDLIRQSGVGGPQVTGSVGATIVEDGAGLSATGLLMNADLALYRAKEEGRDRISFIDSAEDKGLRWINEIREAIETGRLELHGQPIFDLTTGEHYADELLVRMVDREGKLVAAKDFIPIAERFGLIRKLDHWVVSRAVEEAAGGRRVSVNLSAASIGDTELTDLVAARLRQFPNVDPGLITFEITETVATPTIEVLKGFSERVEQLGCGLSLDDVGTGFGTLTYLQNLRFSQLKIDMAFVQRILASPTDAGIVRSLVVIGRELGLETVAEGIESAEILDALLGLGVDRAQGYYLGRPGPLAPTAAFMARRRANATSSTIRPDGGGPG